MNIQEYKQFIEQRELLTDKARNILNLRGGHV